MKTRLVISNLLLVTICVLICSCSSKSEVYTDGIESHELYRIKVGGKCGFINEHGKLVIEPQFDRAYWYFSDGVCYAENGERKGLINTDGEFILDLDNSIYRVRDFQNGVANFLDNELREGLINESGEILMPASFQEIIDDNIGFIVKDTLGRFGYVNHHGQLIAPCQYGDILGINEGVMAVKMNDKYGYIDTTGAWVIDAVFDEARSFGNNLARVKVGEKWQFIDHDGRVVDRFNYDDILTGFSCNRAFVRNGNAVELIDTNGTRIAVVEADSVYGFNEGYATFKKNGKFGKLDTIGNVVIQPIFEHLFITTNGMSVFEKNGKQGLIDNAGNIIVDASHEKCFGNRDLLLFEDDNWQRGTYYDREGNLVWKDIDRGYSLPDKPTKDDWRSFFDARMADLDPIEGLYYVERSWMYQNRANPSIVGSYGGDAWFCSVALQWKTKRFVVLIEGSLNTYLPMEFEKIGNSEKYAIMEPDTTSSSKYISSFVMENPYEFGFQLATGSDRNYNYYCDYTFTRDYPTKSVFEQVQQPEWTGTGFAIANGFVATNYHVTNGAKTIMVRGINGDVKEAYKGYVVASDRDHDLSIVRIMDIDFKAFGEIPYCIGKTMPEVGDDVFVLGYPMTNTMGQEIKLTDGIISAMSGYKGNPSMYQISAAVQPGNSGGPLFDSEGNVIGIVSAKHADAENANYAIKVSYLYSLVNSSGLGIKISDDNKVKSKLLSQKVKKVKPFVYLIECQSH